MGRRRLIRCRSRARADGRRAQRPIWPSQGVFAWRSCSFAILSAFCAGALSLLSSSWPALAQGAAAALLVPASLALLGTSFPEAERGRAIGTWSAFASLTGGDWPIAGRVADRPVVLAAGVPDQRAARSGDTRDRRGLRPAAGRAAPSEGAIDIAGAIAITVALGALTAALTLSSSTCIDTSGTGMLVLTGAAAFVGCSS